MPSLFNGLDNLLGDLQPDVTRRLRAVVTTPNAVTWTDAAPLILRADRALTLWQAVRAVDPTFQNRYSAELGWERTPDQLLIMRALRHARLLPRR